MRKYIVGAIVGALLMFSGQALADTISIIGKKVQAEYSVEVDGKKLNTKAVGIDGASYAPLRAIADATGYDVGFMNKTVTFTKEGDSVTDVELKLKLSSLIGKINVAIGDIQGTERLIGITETTLKDDTSLSAEARTNTEIQLSELKAKLEIFKVTKIELEAEKKTLEALIQQ